MDFIFKHTIFFIYLFVVFTCTTSLLSHDKECLALYQFKQSILHHDYASSNPHGFQKLYSWKKIIKSSGSSSGSGCCLWDGVVCSKKGHVVELDLSRSSLRGPINSSTTLFNLVHLEILNLSMNDFIESQIPSEISHLKQLRILDLSNSRFSGQIPCEISHLIHLSSLHLSWNPLKLQNPNLGNLVQNLTKLEELHLSGINISSSVPCFLANFSSLRSIYLEDCQLRDEFPSEILHLPLLYFLSMKQNPNLHGSLPEFLNTTLLKHLVLDSTSFVGIIPESIGKLINLEFLSLSRCYFSGRVPSSLSNMTQLTHLSLSLNKLTGLIPSLESLSKLIFLEISDNHFEKGRLPIWLSKLTKLNEIYVNNINICDEIPPSIANLTTLRIISMAENFISGHIPSWFMNLTQLSVIDFGRNQLEGKVLNSFSNFKNLQYLGLDHNNFSGRVDLDTFAQLKNLETLYLSYNIITFVDTKNYTDGILPQLRSLGLSSCNLKEFPEFLRYQKRMLNLFFYDNKIEGLVPEWIWNNSQTTLHLIGLSYNFITGFQGYPHFLPWLRLELFEISNNKLEGKLPIPPRTTVIFDVSNNNLIGEIPSSICEVKSLRVLDLSSNNMSGTLPPCFDDLSNSLIVLDLKQNNFHGPMMNAFTRGSPLKRIDLSENQFTGMVLESLANCTSLEFLSLGDNSFEDVFPPWLGSLVELQVLILRSNKFYGVIQDLTTNTSHFLKLRIIDLSNNDFSGQLPDKFFQTWNAMKFVYDGNSSSMGFEILFDTFIHFDFPYSMTLTNKGAKREYKKILNIFTSIDLSCNNFGDEIPQSLQDLNGLESLNLSNNHLTGHILPSLGNLKNLESLDLSRNKLSGKIPQQLLQLGFLAILNVSFNHLEGHVPQGKQFNTFENNSYIGNPGLCGEPLCKECQDLKASSHPITRNHHHIFPPHDEIEWIVIFLGVGSGLVIRIVLGNFLYSKYTDRFVYTSMKDISIRPLRNTRRNNGQSRDLKSLGHLVEIFKSLEEPSKKFKILHYVFQNFRRSLRARAPTRHALPPPVWLSTSIYTFFG